MGFKILVLSFCTFSSFRSVTLALSFFLTVLYLNFNETPQPSLRELEKMIKEIEVSEINEKDNSEEMEREQYINDNSRENWDLSGDILDCFKRYSNELKVFYVSCISGMKYLIPNTLL